MQAALIQEACERAGLEASSYATVGDGEQAITYLLDALAPAKKLRVPSVLITDMKMPKMGGLDLLAWVRNNSYYKTLPVIILGIVAGEDERQIANTLKCDGFFEKPFQFAEWLNLIKLFHEWPPYTPEK